MPCERTDHEHTLSLDLNCRQPDCDATVTIEGCDSDDLMAEALYLAEVHMQQAHGKPLESYNEVYEL